MSDLDGNQNAAPRAFRFDEFSFDVGERLLYRNNEVIQLPPKTCELLGVFLENRGRLLSKDELMNTVWQNTFVEEANLTHHIAVLRKTFGEGNNFIQTIPRKGYRFVADLKSANDETSEITLTEKTRVEIVAQTIFEQDITSETQIGELIGRKDNHWIWAIAVFVLILAAVGSLFLWRNFGVKSQIVPPEVKVKRLMPDTNAYAVSIAPDGESVVFMMSENESETMWRRQLATGEMTQILPTDKSGEFGIIATRFSPDGKWIYYKHAVSDFAQSEIYRVGASGGTPQKIASKFEGDFSISPDGKQVAFQRDCRQLIVADIETGIERVAAQRDGEIQIIKCSLLSSTAWSPDGKRIVYCAGTIENNQYEHQLWEVNLETGAENQIPIPKDFGAIYQIEWLPDGTGLLVTHDKHWALPDQIWHISYPGGEVRRVTDETDDFDRTIRLSADGKKLAAKQTLGHYNLWIAPIDDLSKRKQITPGAAAQHGNYGLTFTPDGKIVYTSTESGAVDLWRIDNAGGGKRQLTVNAGTSNQNPVATKDGRYLVFTSTRTGVMQVWRMDIDGRNPVQLSRGSEYGLLGLSPENEVYYAGYSAEEKKNLIYKVPIEGGEPVLVDNRNYSADLEFSPDGKWISFYGNEKAGETPRNGLIERSTGKIVRYFDKVVGLSRLRWMPDSKSLIFVDSSGKILMRQSIEGGEPQKLADFKPNGIYTYDFSPDGKNIVFSLGNTTAEAVLIENFSYSDAK